MGARPAAALSGEDIKEHVVIAIGEKKSKMEKVQSEW